MRHRWFVSVGGLAVVAMFVGACRTTLGHA